MRDTRKEIRQYTGRFDTVKVGGDLDMSLGVEAGHTQSSLIGILHSFWPLISSFLRLGEQKRVKVARDEGELRNESLNLLKSTCYVMHQQFNIQQLYALPTLYLCVLYLSENKQRLVPLTA